MLRLISGRRKYVCLALCGLWIAAVSQAQTTGIITRTVTDSSGAVVSGVKIVVQNIGTHKERTLITNASGIYTAYSLPVGQYDVEATLAGFKKTTQTEIQLNVADQLSINFVLQIGSNSETVQVSAENSTQVDTEKADVNYLVETRQMTDLAVNGRTFTLLQQLLPGASRDPGTGDEGGTGFNSSKGFAINGQRQEATGFLVDGVENTDVGNSNGLLTSPGMETISEFKMVTSN